MKKFIMGLFAMTLVSTNVSAVEVLGQCKMKSNNEKLTFTVIGESKGNALLVTFLNGMSEGVEKLEYGNSYKVYSPIKESDEIASYILRKSKVKFENVSFARAYHLQGEEIQMITIHAKDGKQLAAAVVAAMAMPVLCDKDSAHTAK